MLASYLTRTEQLLQNPGAPSSLYSTPDLTEYINLARGQMAGDAECMRIYTTLPVAGGTQQYPFSAVDLTSAVGVRGVLNIRTAWLQIASGQAWMRPRPFEWFSLYELNNPVPQQGQPKVWSQFAQGVDGSIFVSPVPDAAYVLQLDTLCYPIDLLDDTTVEAIPFPWTDAVPFLAAYYALLSAQSAARQADADRMFARYEEYRNRARRFSNPVVMPYIYPQVGDPVRANKLGQQPAGGGGQG
jgi:hypothetical protein